MPAVVRFVDFGQTEPKSPLPFHNNRGFFLLLIKKYAHISSLDSQKREEELIKYHEENIFWGDYNSYKFAEKLIVEFSIFNSGSFILYLRSQWF